MQRMLSMSGIMDVCVHPLIFIPNHFYSQRVCCLQDDKPRKLSKVQLARKLRTGAASKST